MSVHFFLTGGELTWQYKRALRTALVHEDEIVLWYTRERPEADCTVRRAKIPAWLEHSGPQTVFNYLSLETMYYRGGMAFGLDSISLRSAQDLLPEGKEFGVACGYPDEKKVAHPFHTDYVGRSGCEVIPLILDELKRRVVKGLGPTDYTTGPMLLTSYVYANPDKIAIIPFPVLCGWSYEEAWRFYEGEEPSPEVRVIQLFASGYPGQFSTFQYGVPA